MSTNLRNRRARTPTQAQADRPPPRKTQLLRFPTAAAHDPAIDTWMSAHAGPLGAIARHWFDVMRACGDDVRELLHDGHPTATRRRASTTQGSAT